MHAAHRRRPHPGRGLSSTFVLRETACLSLRLRLRAGARASSRVPPSGPRGRVARDALGRLVVGRGAARCGPVIQRFRGREKNQKHDSPNASPGTNKRSELTDRESASERFAQDGFSFVRATPPEPDASQFGSGHSQHATVEKPTSFLGTVLLPGLSISRLDARCNAHHPHVQPLLVAEGIPSTIVRWSATAVGESIEDSSSCHVQITVVNPASLRSSTTTNGLVCGCGGGCIQLSRKRSLQRSDGGLCCSKPCGKVIHAVPAASFQISRCRDLGA